MIEAYSSYLGRKDHIPVMKFFTQLFRAIANANIIASNRRHLVNCFEFREIIYFVEVLLLKNCNYALTEESNNE